MRTARMALLLGAALLPAAARAADEAGGKFPLRDGDIWVMAGDSITAQHLHSNYFEAFCYARYPNLKFAFRNSGVGGHTIPTTLARFDYDIAAWNPTPSTFSFFVYPVVTPTTMLLIKARVSPCSARFCRSSSGRVTVIAFPSEATFMFGW